MSATTTTSTTTPDTTPATRVTHLLLRAGWAGATLFFGAFAVLEGVHHGVLASVAAGVFFIAPDLTFLAGARDAHAVQQGQLPPRAVPYYNAAHRALVPLALLALSTVTALTWAPLLAALCGWMTHICLDHTFGYGLRTKEGFQRG